MITIQEVKQEINDLQNTETKDLKKSEINKMRKRMEFLKTIHYYLLNEPSSEFIKSELHRLSNKIDMINNEYSLFSISGAESMSEKRRLFEKEMGVPKIRLQIKTLKYLLKR